MNLIEAIKQNNQAEFFRLLNLKTDPFGKRFIDEVDEYGGGPLHWAAFYGYAHFIAPLIQAGADINRRQDKRGVTPMHIAAEEGHAAAITALKAVGANVDMPSHNGSTPVFMAACYGHSDAIIALKAAGANIDTPNHNGSTPIYIAAVNGYPKVITVLKAAGANVNTSCAGITPIFAAVQAGHREVIQALLAAGADVSTSTPHGTPLEQAKKGKDPSCAEIVRLLEAYLAQYPNGIKTVINTHREAVSRPDAQSEPTKPKNLPTVMPTPILQNNLDSSLSDFSFQAGVVSPGTTLDVASKAEANPKAHQVVEGFVAAVRRCDDVEAKAGRDVITVAGGVKVQQGAVVIGGGHASSTPEVSLRNPASDTKDGKEETELDDIAVLKKLKMFFMSNKYKGSESQDCDLYNRALDAHKAILVYDEGERVHKLFVNDEPLEPRESIKIISKMMESLQLSNAQDANLTPNAASAPTGSGHTRVQARAGRDVITVTGGITSGGSLRIGGGDTQRRLMAYDQFKNQGASKYGGLSNRTGNIQLSIRTEISRAIKSINHVKT